MPLPALRSPKARPVYNEYRLTGGGTSGKPLTGKISALTGKPLLHSAIGHALQSEFSKVEVTAKVSLMGPANDTFAFDAAPHFNSLAELEAVIGRPLQEGEWVKTIWSTLEHDQGATDWRFDDRWPEYSAKHQVTAGDRTSLVSFINTLGDTHVDAPVKGFDGVKRAYLLRRLELDVRPPPSNFSAMANQPSIGALELAMNMNVTLTEASFTTGRPVKILEGAAISIVTGDVFNSLPSAGHHRAAIEWKADGVRQKPVVLIDGPDASLFVRKPALPVTPGTRRAEYTFSVEHSPTQGEPVVALQLPARLTAVRSFEIVPAVP